MNETMQKQKLEAKRQTMRSYERFLMREVAVALGHLTTPEWGDAMSNKPAENRRAHLTATRDKLRTAATYADTLLTLFNQAEAIRAETVPVAATP